MNKQAVYERLVEYIVENQDRFYRLAYSYTRQKQDALDIVQSAVCKALQEYESIRNAEAVKTWFYRILVNECLTALKKRSKIVLSADYPKQEAVYYEKGYEEGENIEELLDGLESDVSQIIRLRFFEEMSLKEISDITGLNLNTVKTKLYRGLKELKENIEEEDL